MRTVSPDISLVGHFTEIAKRVATKIITCSRSRIESLMRLVVRATALTRLYALTLNESHYVRHYRRTYYLPYYRNLKFRSCASHLLRLAAKLCAPQIAVSRAAEPRRTVRSIVDLSRGASRAYQRARGKRAPSLHLGTASLPSRTTLCADKVLTTYDGNNSFAQMRSFVTRFNR